MQTKTDISYGVIPLRRGGDAQDWDVLVIHQRDGGRGRDYWTFPKGHAEGEETPQQTATRELYEETGLTVDNLSPQPTFSNEYTYHSDDVQVHKTAAYFLATVQAGDVSRQVAEVNEAMWLPIDQVEAKLDYDSNRTMWRQVYQWLQQNPDQLPR